MQPEVTPISEKFEYLNRQIGIQSKVPFGASISEIITNLGLINLVFFIIGAIFMGGLLGAAVSYVTSQGSPEAINKANSRLINSLIGLTIVFGSFIIVRLVLATIGSSSITPF